MEAELGVLDRAVGGNAGAARAEGVPEGGAVEAEGADKTIASGDDPGYLRGERTNRAVAACEGKVTASDITMSGS